MHRPIDPGLIRRVMVDSPVFAKACELAKVPVTRRQAAKWIRGKGAAHNFNKQAMEIINATEILNWRLYGNWRGK